MARPKDRLKVAGTIYKLQASRLIYISLHASERGFGGVDVYSWIRTAWGRPYMPAVPLVLAFTSEEEQPRLFPTIVIPPFEHSAATQISQHVQRHGLDSKCQCKHCNPTGLPCKGRFLDDALPGSDRQCHSPAAILGFETPHEQGTNSCVS